MYAQTEPGVGGKGIASFIVDLQTAGIEKFPPYELVGGAAIGACGVRLQRVRVADRDLFAPPGQAFKRALHSISAARVYVSAMACAVVETAIRTAVAYAGERQSFGRPLLDHQGLRWSLAGVVADLEAARLLTLQGAHAVARGVDAQVDLRSPRRSRPKWLREASLLACNRWAQWGCSHTMASAG
jgi:alkylation response protein AidB-like acyl-CoA dehydrogenase